MPKGQLPPRVSCAVVGHKVQPLPVVGNIRKSDIQKSLSQRDRLAREAWGRALVGDGLAFNNVGQRTETLFSQRFQLIGTTVFTCIDLGTGRHRVLTGTD